MGHEILRYLVSYESPQGCGERSVAAYSVADAAAQCLIEVVNGLGYVWDPEVGGRGLVKILKVEPDRVMNSLEGR